MGGITTGIGIFSGIDTGSLIEQLLAVEGRPRILAQQRLIQLQTQQAAYLDLNTRLGALKSAAAKFRNSLTFDTKLATPSVEGVLAATAGTSAAQGTYSFIVDRLVSSQQLLSRGFADSDASAVGIGSVTIEDHRARLDREVNLALLNDGDGIDRGKIRITVGAATTDVDLSRAATVDDVLEAINESAAGVTASVQDGAFVIDGNGQTVSVASVGSAQTAETLGLTTDTDAGTTTILEGATVYTLNTNTSLASLNDGTGVRFKTDSLLGADFTIDVGGNAIKINLGEIFEDDPGEDGVLDVIEGAVSTVGGLIDRVNSTLSDAGATGVSMSIDAATGALSINTGGFAVTLTDGGVGALEDLGFADGLVITNPYVGERVFAGIGETLLSSLNGGSGLASLTSLDITTQDGSSFSVDVSGQTTIQGVLRAINDAASTAGADLVASLNSVGTGILVTDNTTGGSNLTITSADTTAADLGLDTGVGGVTTGEVDTGSLQLQYIAESTRLADLNRGQGVGTGEIRFTDSTGAVFSVNVGEDSVSIGDIIDEINGQASAASSNIVARINDTGDGLLIEDTSGGAVPIKVEDASGSVGAKLRIVGDSESADPGLNVIDGTFEYTVEFDPTDTLEDVARKINEAGGGVSASILNDGGGGNSFRLALTSQHSGRSGRFTFDTHGFDLGLDTLDDGDDAVVFYGSSDPANAVLLQSSTNTLDSVLNGVTIDLLSPSEETVNLTIATDNEAIETDIKSFISAFNEVVSRIKTQTRYVQETDERGPLLGDGTAISLRSQLYAEILGTNSGFASEFDSLAEVGITVGDGGRLELDEERFREALAQDPQSVRDLFTRRVIDPDAGTEVINGVTVTDPNADIGFSELGLIVKIEEFADKYIDSISGVLTRKRNAIDTQIQIQQDRIDFINEKLEARRQVLEAQFIAMERAIAEAQNISGSLASIGLV